MKFAFDRGCINTILELGQREQQQYPKRQLAIIIEVGRFGGLNSGKPHRNAFLHPEIRVSWRFAKSVSRCDSGG